jgi:two-component system, chemotaxis family, protein-glutamate methylesterase/glutaminase
VLREIGLAREALPESQVTVAYEIVVVGTSWGGLSALRELVSALPAVFSLPVVVVQHRHRQSDHLLPTLLQDSTALPVCEIEDKSPITGGHVHVAPADYHLLIEYGSFSLSIDEPVRYSRPSIDVTFVSAADTYGRRAVGVILTGANADGSRGLERIHERGGLALVQLPATAESPMMPAAALHCVPTARALPIAEIATTLAALAPAAAVPPSPGGRAHLDTRDVRP